MHITTTDNHSQTDLPIKPVSEPTDHLNQSSETSIDWLPHVTVAMVVESEGRFLLVEEESDGIIVFNQPAGHWDEGETLVDAAIRETLEETRWQVVPEAMIGLYQYTNPATQITYLRVCFSGKPSHCDSARPLDKGILQAVWLSYDEIVATPNLRSPMVLRCIKDYLTGIRYPLTLITHFTS